MTRHAVLNKALPHVLVEKIGLEVILERLPEAYQRALFSSYVASHFVYKFGVAASQIDFFHYFSSLKTSE